MNATCSCMILNYNDAGTVMKLIEDIKDFPVFHHILIVDNCSTDDSYAKLQGLNSEKITLIQTDRNGGYGYGNNFGARYIKEAFQSDYILLANPDVVFSNSLIQRFVDLMEEKQELALVSAIQHDINDQPIQDLAWRVPTSFEYAILNSGKFGRFFPTTHQLDFSLPVQYVDCFPGALLLFDTDRFLQVGGYDEEMFLFGEETTLGFKLKEAGYKSLLVLDDFYRHEHSTSINKSIEARSKQLEILYDSRLLFMKKYLKSNWLMLALASFFQKRTLRKLRDQEK